MKPNRQILTLTLCFILAASFTVIFQIKPARATNIVHVPTDVGTIQAAVNNANQGDTIIIDPGTYYEHVVINKTLTVKGVNKATTIVDGSGSGSAFRLDADRITLTDLTIRNGGNSHSAVQIDNSAARNDYHNVSNNIITTSRFGIYMSLSKRDTLSSNALINNYISGIELSFADQNDIFQNTVSRSVYGIKLANSVNNVIADNTITSVSYGIHLSLSSTGTQIYNNVVLGQTAGIFVNSNNAVVHHNTATESSYGIWLYDCINGNVYYNTVANNSYGIRIQWSSTTISTHTINNNKIIDNEWGIEVVNSNQNTFMGNWLQRNTYGISLASAAYSTLYRNNFVNNVVQATTTADNTWDKNGNGNYWSDYPPGHDPDGNGIGNIPYAIPPGQDNYPLIYTWSEHDIAVLSVTPSATEVNQGVLVTITVTVKNRANITTSETFTVTTKYNSLVIGTQQVTALTQGATRILTFNWDTTGVAVGDYTISALASTVIDELNTDNNNFVDGNVTILQMRDVAILSVQPSKTIAYAEYGEINIEVDAKNEGTSTETFNVTAYYNSAAIGTQTITLGAGATQKITFIWNTVSIQPNNYTISATAESVPGETDLSDNSLSDGTVRIKIPGDLDGNERVNLLDVADVSAHWYPGPPTGPLGYDLNADINNDGHVDILDAGIVSANWGRTA